jgi:acetolactate synthase I/II/III large subunit
MKHHKPIVIAGNGIRLSNSINHFKEFLGKYQIPFVTSYLGKDLMPTDHPLNIGVMGIKGNKAANMATQNADLIINLGSRLSTGQIGYDGEFINKDADMICVDIDITELSKYDFSYKFINNHIHLDLSLLSTWKHLLDNLSFECEYNEWVKQCQYWKDIFKIIPSKSNYVDIYDFIHKLNDIIDDDDVIVSDAGIIYFAIPQTLQIKGNRRWITSGAQAAMGFSLPASVGVCIARGKKRVICITGDGSFQLNIQELATIRKYNLPIIIFVLNNGGYTTIKNTQNRYFNGNYVGSSDKDLYFPNLAKICDAYDIYYDRIYKINEFKNINILNEAVLIEVMCDSKQLIQV